MRISIIFFLIIIINVILAKIIIKFKFLKRSKDASFNSLRWGKSNKPHLGGLLFYISYIISFIFIFLNENNLIDISKITSDQKKIIALTLNFTYVFFSGVVDELKRNNTYTKLIIQILAYCIFIWGGVYISISEMFWINILFTLILYLFFINIICIYDNIDLGLAPISTILIFFFIFLLSKSSQNFNLIHLLIAFILGLLVFIYYNYYPSKLFMGDMGSLLISNLLFFLTVDVLFNANLVTGKIEIFNTIILCSVLYSIFLYDFLNVIFIRFKNNKNIFHGDTNHLSHKFNEIFSSPNKTSFFFISINIFSILIFYILWNNLVNIFYSLLFSTLFHLILITLLLKTYKILKKIN